MQESRVEEKKWLAYSGKLMLRSFNKTHKIIMKLTNE